MNVREYIQDMYNINIFFSMKWFTNRKPLRFLSDGLCSMQNKYKKCINVTDTICRDRIIITLEEIGRA